MNKSIKFQDEVANYTKVLAKFMYINSLPEEWFTKPDHIAIKAKDASTYDAHVEFWKERAIKSRISEIKLNGRRLGIVKLKEPISIGLFGLINWLEIMEPRPKKVGKDVVGLDHIEFYCPNFEEVMEVLKTKDIIAKRQKNLSHEWISIILKNGQELKLNNSSLAKKVTKEIKTGDAVWVG